MVILTQIIELTTNLALMKLDNEWINKLGLPLIIAGPCSVETQDQTEKTITDIASNGGVQIVRGGIWKPRTKPNNFEGVGKKGLPWLTHVAAENNLLSTCEVANAEHVADALASKVDILWIGARTTTNPFAVQEIAEALKGTDIPVLIKNPINPDLELWIGAFERFNNVGLTQLAAIHRGFSLPQATHYRNHPMWEIPIELKRRHPELKIICDPSHITGKSENVQEVAQKAFDLDFDGLMIETHCNPKEAWSDARQQITPDELNAILKTIVRKKSKSENELFKSELEVLRKEIDLIDREIINRLSYRMRLAKKIGAYKKDNNVTVLQSERWREIVEDRLEVAEELNLNKEFIKAYLELVHQESISQQSENSSKI